MPAIAKLEQGEVVRQGAKAFSLTIRYGELSVSDKEGEAPHKILSFMVRLADDQALILNLAEAEELHKELKSYLEKAEWYSQHLAKES